MALSDKAARSKDRAYRTPQLQHRHFSFIAACIRDLPRGDLRLPIANVFASACRRTNPAFDSARFMDASNAVPSEWTQRELDIAITHATLWLDHLKQARVELGFKGNHDA